MSFTDICGIMNSFIRTSPLNRVAEMGDLRIFASPLIGIASAFDELFQRLRHPEAVGENHLLPSDWLPGAQTVISYFLPFTKEVRSSNRLTGLPSQEWLYGRIEGQLFNNALGMMLVDYLQHAGHQAVSPSLDPRFQIVNRRSNWSERHVSFIAGLGTLSLNRSLITKVGSAGRIGSVVTNLQLPATPRYYTEIEENCSHCGACIRRCPPQDIAETGKDHAICAAYLDSVLQRFTPRYGCGKCQTAVPCEEGIPAHKSNP